MLILPRRIGQKLLIGDAIQVEVVDIRGDKVRLGITAPDTIPIHRAECPGCRTHTAVSSVECPVSSPTRNAKPETRNSEA